MRTHRAVDVNCLAIRKLTWSWIDAAEIVSSNTIRARQLTVDIDVPVLSLTVADLRVITSGAYRLQLAVLEVYGAVPPHEVDIALNVTVRYEAEALQPESILKTLQAHMVQEDSLAVPTHGLRLRSTMRRGIQDGDIP